MAIKIRILEEEPKAAQNIFDKLFREHWDKLQQHDLLASEIEPSLLAEIHRAIEEMDSAWLRGDLKSFTNAMNETERLYFKAEEIHKKEG